MIRCHVTATGVSTAQFDASGQSADQLLSEAIRLSAASGHDVALVDTPAEADVIIFAETHQDYSASNDALRQVLREPTYRQHITKCVVHSGQDIPNPIIPGMYPSISRNWAPRLGCEGAPYLASLNPYLESVSEAEHPVEHLASFTGSCAVHPLRRRLLKIADRDKWTDVIVSDTGPEFVATIRSGDIEAHLRLKREFAANLIRSKFVLCPRGAGASSFRIFETMQVGRVPVVIADDWAPPPGPDWQKYLIRIPESKLASIPDILQQHLHNWQSLGRAARLDWERYYGPTNFGAWIVQRAFEIMENAGQHRRRRSARVLLYVHGPRRLTIRRKQLTRRFDELSKRCLGDP